MSWLNEFYHRLMHAAVANDSSTAQDPVTIRFVFPPRIGTLTTRLSGGAVQTADVIIPGCVVTLVVAEVMSLPTPGGTLGVTGPAQSEGSVSRPEVQQTSASGPLPETDFAYISESPPAYPPPQHAHPSGASTYPYLNTSMDFSSSDASQLGADVTYAMPSIPPMASQCARCAAEETPCWCSPAEHEVMLDMDPERFPDAEGLLDVSLVATGDEDADMSFAESVVGMYPGATDFF